MNGRQAIVPRMKQKYSASMCKKLSRKVQATAEKAKMLGINVYDVRRVEDRQLCGSITH